MIIYQITNKLTNDFYIGKTKNQQERFYRHKYNATNNKSQTYIHRAMRKYGVENFTFSVLEQVESPEFLNQREMYWIDQLKPKYNMTRGGDGGDTSNSSNYRAAIKRIHSNKNPKDYATYGMLGKKQSCNFFEAITKANSCPVSCDGVVYDSVGKAQSSFPGISIRKRLDSEKYPTFFRLRPKTRRK
jgi:group I intron endonuclease